MVFLSIFSVILSGFGFGFGGVAIKSTKAVNIWEIRFVPKKSRGRLRAWGIAAFWVSIAVLLLSVVSLYKVWSGEMLICTAMYLCLWVIFLVIGGVLGDFILAKHREFSEISFLLLGKIDSMQTAGQKLRRAYAAAIGFEGMAFIDKEGRVFEVLIFADMGLECLRYGVETDILCQYFKSIAPEKEIHGLSNRLSSVFNMKTPGGNICIAQNAEKNMRVEP